ncbi:YdeI/OmpD-associated family protein [Macrococcoides canis]
MVPEEILSTFAEDKAYEEHFYKLTPGRQRAYIIEINKAKKVKLKSIV